MKMLRMYQYMAFEVCKYNEMGLIAYMQTEPKG